jgi:hypothetical protein
LKDLDPITTQQYIEKADHFLQAMKLAALELATYRTGIALLAVHSAISLNDAITAGLTGKRGRHRDTWRPLRNWNTFPESIASRI